MEFERRVVDLDVNDVLPNRFQPRIKFNEDSINELCESIKEHGVIQPIVVRAMGDKYEIIAGERRYKASLLAGKQTIPAVITELNDKDSAEVALIENVQRKDLTPIEEAISYKKILDMGYLTQEELAVKLGKTQSTVANKLRLLNLDEEVQEAVLEEKISERHARSLLRLINMSDQKKMLDKIIENRLTVRKTDEEINKLLNGSDSDDAADSEAEKVILPTYSEDKEENINPFKINPISSSVIPTFDSTNIVDANTFVDEPIVIIDDHEQLPIINEDQVVVDPTEEFNPFQLDNVSVGPTAQPINENIPSNPIEETTEENMEGEKMSEFETANSPELNPGFMNIDKIEASAKDINMPGEKESIDINSLLKPSIIGGETPAVESEKAASPEEAIKVGKFFELPIDDEKSDEVKEEATQKSIATGITNAFDFNLSDQNLMSIPSNEVSNSPEVLSDAVATSPTYSEPVNSNIAELNIPINTNKVEDLGLSEIINPITVLDEANNAPETAFVPEQAPQSFVPEQVAPTIAEENSSNNMINSNFDFNISAPVEREELTLQQSASSEEMPIPTQNAGVAQNKSMPDALELIRNNVKALENLGYSVDTEEFDFENVYQVIIKIEK